MRAEPIRVSGEIHEGRGIPGDFYLGRSPEIPEALAAERPGTVKLVYMDPPFQTGSSFRMRVRVGEEDWKKGVGSLELRTYADTQDREAYLAMMRRVLTACRTLLSDDGMLFLHLDWRMHPYLRLLGDEIFGERNLLNEIVWQYQSGGRSLRHFSRKHDTLLFYAKGRDYDFHIEDVMERPAGPRTNHMRRHVDPDGRVYRSIRSNGRVYTYYDDDPVAPTDVWQDLNHLQQKDPERTGYDVQKPLALLDRIVKCASRPGDWVLDPFAGSATTLEAAKLNGRNFIGIERCPLTLNIARRRLVGADYRILLDGQPEFEPTPVCSASVHPGVGFYHVYLEDFRTQIEGMDEGADPLDALDNWSVGYLRPEGYQVMAEFARGRKEGALRRELAAPAYAGDLAMCVSDVLGRCHYFALDREQ